MTHIHDEEVRELRNTISELQGYIAQAESNLRVELAEQVRQIEYSSNDRHIHLALEAIIDEVLALLEKELG